MNPGQTSPQPSLGIVAQVVHARQVPSEARERFGDAAAELVADGRVIVLRTCHRVEVYAAVPVAGANGDLQPSVPLPELPPGGQRFDGHEAIRHLFAVAAGLDSVVVGEDQILHQLRECLSGRQLASLEATGGACAPGHRPTLPDDVPGELEPILDRLFQLALHVGRQSRAWYEGPPRSLADVALDRIEAVAGDLAGRPVLVVGAGRMSRLAALAATRRRARVLVSNRTADRARSLAADVGGETVAFGAVPEDAPGVIVAVGGPWAVDQDAATALVRSSTVVVDLSSPPAVGNLLSDQLGARFVSGDDIARGTADPVRDRVRRRIERLIDEADVELTRWLGGRAAVPVIRALTEHAETRRAAEVDRLLRRMPHLPERDRDLVEQMSHRLVAGLLHAPLASLREDQTGEHDRAARELFSL
jgi:glutamyl-tRNA reductase